MLRNHLLIVLRTLRKRLGHTIINIAGLAVGLACCLLIGLFVLHEQSYDQFHSKADRTYRLLNSWRAGVDLPPPTPEEYRVWGSAAPAPLMQVELPEVETTVRVSGRHTMLVARDNLSFREERYLYADSTFFEVFDFTLLRGDPTTVLSRDDTMVLTESAARRYFGDIDPVGQTLVLNNSSTVTVTGLMQDVPSNSHLDFDMLISMVTFEQNTASFRFTEWGYIDFFTYVLLRPNTDPEVFEAKLSAFADRHMSQHPRIGESTYYMSIEPLLEAYLGPTGGRLPGPSGNQTNLIIFSWIGFFVLLIAGINFTNLSTARSMERAREVGLRKVVGALRGGLIRQFLTESLVISLLAMGLALVLAEVTLPMFRNLTGKAIASSVLIDPAIILSLLSVTIAVGLLAGLYPAFVLSSFQPAQVLKGAFKRTGHGVRLRQTLVVLQFSLSIGLIACTLVVFAQLEFLQSQELGFNDAQQLVIDFGGDNEIYQQRHAMIDEFRAITGVQQVSMTRSIPGGYRPGAGTDIERPNGEMDGDGFGLFEIDFGFLEQMDIDMVAGRSFQAGLATDSTEALIINAAAARHWGYADPADAVGRRFEQWGRTGTIIGVTEDFHHLSLHHEVWPLFFRISPPSTRYFVLEVTPNEVANIIARLEQQWRTWAPHHPFLYSFLDDSFGTQYSAETRFGELFSIFAGLAILIACLGLFGLATFTTQQRIKEVGIRKTLGATTSGLIRLLSIDFLKLVGIAFLIAAPVAWLAMGQWLEGFSYRVPMGPGVFLLAGLLAVLISLATIAYQAIRTASANPIDALRYE